MRAIRCSNCVEIAVVVLVHHTADVADRSAVALELRG